jgi:DNA-directed RNA polymerase specialized sigma24 family protein
MGRILLGQLDGATIHRKEHGNKNISLSHFPDVVPSLARTPEDAFDSLHKESAPGLIRQAYVLTGSRRLAFESVERAFQRAWQHWPEVASAVDPVGWVRSRVHEYALSPWHRFRRIPDRVSPPSAGTSTTLFGAMLRLPERHRRAAVLCDGLGLCLSQAAAETESSTRAVMGRLVLARDVLDQHLAMADEPGAAQVMLRTFLAQGPTPTMASARYLRTSGEGRARLLARVVYAGVAAFTALVSVVIVFAPSTERSPSSRRHVPMTAPADRGPSLPTQLGPRAR